MREFEHVEVSEFSGFSIINTEDVIGFLHIAEAFNVKIIFRKGAIDRDSPPELFFFNFMNIVYTIKADGFIFLQDFVRAIEKKFPSAQEYYEAKKKGFDSYDEYKHSINAGGGGKVEFEEAKAAGFAKGFDSFLKKYSKYKAYQHTSIIDENIDSSIKLFDYAKRKGFPNYTEFEKAYDAGYPEMTIFKEAISKGFKSSEDYFDAINKGFSFPTEYELAKEKLIHSKKEYDNYRYLKDNNFYNMAFDEYQLVQLLKEFPNGRKLTLSELRDDLKEKQEKYKRSFSDSPIKVLPMWYIQTIDDDEKLHSFLSNSDEIKKLGTYNPSDKSFEIFIKSRTKVYVDGSNVAHDSYNAKGIFYKNIRLVVQELNIWGFTDVVVIADATLRHRAKDAGELEKIKKICAFHESPSHASADLFLLELIHHDGCIIVSNDGFADWQRKDFWVRANIDKIRVTFMITGDKVSFSGIENHVEKTA